MFVLGKFSEVEKIINEMKVKIVEGNMFVVGILVSNFGYGCDFVKLEVEVDFILMVIEGFVEEVLS